ncbi:MAG: hypothetical protein JSR45_13970 [Proteobacteria bacterium]|nr:hypothetical protein [Pseudomonadota bacterium]
MFPEAWKEAEQPATPEEAAAVDAVVVNEFARQALRAFRSAAPEAFATFEQDSIDNWGEIAEDSDEANDVRMFYRVCSMLEDAKKGPEPFLGGEDVRTL